MHFFRAGLFAVTLTIALFTASTSAAPLPITQSLSSTVASTLQSTALRHQLRSHALHTPGGGHAQQAFAIKTTNTLASESDGVASRDVVGLERRNIFSKIKHAFQKIGHGIKHIAKKIGHGIKHVAQKIGKGIKKVAQKVGHGIKTAAKKVGHFIKTTGAKIAKVGLKVWSTVQKVAGKVAGFIPGVGKVLGKALDGASAVTNAISNKIHVKIGGKLGKAMRGMDKARKITGYIPRALPEDALEEREELNARYGYDVDIYAREIYDNEVLYAREKEFELAF